MPRQNKLVYIGDNERIIPNYGVFKPGDEVDYNENLLSTGLFRDKNKKEGDV